MVVLDLSRLLPGPYLTRMLADLGAQVVKIESPEGDLLRHTPPFVNTPNQSSHGGGDPFLGAGFAALNYGKQSMVLDLKHPDGVAVFLAMADKADVVVESFRPGVMDRLGIGYAALAARHPRIIMCSISGYGQQGPYSQRAGHDINYVARAGLLGVSGPAEGAPAIPGVQMADLAGGALSAAVGVMTALYVRTFTQRGRHLDIAMAREVHALLHMELARRAAMLPMDRETRGNGLLTGGVPSYRVYATRDGRYMALGALEPKFFAAFCQAADVPHLAASGLLTGDAGQEVVRTLEKLFASRTQAEWTALLANVDCCCEPVQTPEEAQHDPAIQAVYATVGDIPAIRCHLGGFASQAAASACPSHRAAQPIPSPAGAQGVDVLTSMRIDGALIERAVASHALIMPD